MGDRRSAALLLAAGLLATGLAVASAGGAGGDQTLGTSAGADATTGSASSTPLLSARRLPQWLVTQAADEALRAATDAALDELPATSCAVVRSDGHDALDRNGDDLVTPASTQKILTAFAVLDRLGADAHFRTVAVSEAEPSAGVVDGDVWLVGGGDPVLMTPGYAITWEDPDDPPAHTDLSGLADSLVAAGVTRIDGDVVGDDSRYDTERYPASWPKRYERGSESGPLSALAVNDGFTGLEEDPDTPQSGLKIGDPPLLAAQTLIALLEDRGVTVSGGASVGRAPAATAELAALESPSVGEIVGQMLTYSDNTTAELLLKELAHSADPTGKTAGSTIAGAEVVADVLAAHDLPAEDASIVDGSGLDPTNEVSCSLLVEVLAAAGPDSVLADGLAVTGEAGTLRRRLKGTDAVGHLRGKTGTLAGVSALAGWVDGPEGPVAFAIVSNGEAPTAQTAQDTLVLALLDHPDRPDVADLGPR